MNSSTQHYGTWLDCAIDEWGVGFDSGIPDLAAVAGFRFVGRWNIGWCELVIDWHGLSCPRDDLEAGTFRFNPGTDKESLMCRVSRAVETELTTLDLMLVAPVFEKVWADREVIQLGHQSLKIVSKAGLILMKEVAGRPQDLADIHALRQLESQ